MASASDDTVRDNVRSTIPILNNKQWFPIVELSERDSHIKFQRRNLDKLLSVNCQSQSNIIRWMPVNESRSGAVAR
jgi:hypothetical protein